MWWGGAVVVLAVLGAWIARNTYWAEVQIPRPPKGEALTNPFYAVQRFAEQFGARTSYDRVLDIPPPNAVIVLADWHWDLSASRRRALEAWVADGGRLVIDDGVLGDETTFEAWSGITREFREEEEDGQDTEAGEANTADNAAGPEPGQRGPSRALPCGRYREQRSNPDALSTREYWLCRLHDYTWLSTKRPVAWAVRADDRLHALRVPVGRGSVTVINGSPFRYRGIFDGEHGWLFVAATELRSGDDIHFLSEEQHPSLLALVWLYGRAVVLLGGVLIGLAIWRGAVRLGPLAPAPARARRSLAEQIRGTGQFALRQGGGDALHAACVRALEEAAERRVSGWPRLAAMDRAAALARLTGFDRQALAAAIYHSGLRSPAELRSTIGLLESARRRILQSQERQSIHGTP
jgi:hypothetical protein